jgi:Homing endonuclease associated repeat
MAKEELEKVAKEKIVEEQAAKETIVAAIRRAAEELGRAPSRGELRRITGLSHYRVLAEFPTLREAVRAAGLEPNPKGEKISTEDLLADWKRVAEKLGRRPSRAEYVREGRYSAGALTVRFGSWSAIGNTYHGDTETRRKAKKGSRESSIRNTGRKTRIGETSKEVNHKGHPHDSSFASSESLRAGYGSQRERNGDSVVHNFSRVPLAQLPAPLVGMRKVTEEVAQMVVNTLMGSSWPLAFSSWPNGEMKQNGEPLEGERVRDIQLRKDRPVMGEPFDRSPMTNAPVNELGVMVLFGMVAASLGLQVESVQGKFPDCMAKRQVAPGKWQHLRIEFEYESKNFKLHGHDPKGCDMIVCWRHNWKECPAEIEVVELSRLVGWR